LSPDVFSAIKMVKIMLAAGPPPRTPLRELTALHRRPSWTKGKEGEGKKRRMAREKKCHGKTGVGIGEGGIQEGKGGKRGQQGRGGVRTLVDLNSFSSLIYFALLFDILLAPLDNCKPRSTSPNL